MSPTQLQRVQHPSEPPTVAPEPAQRSREYLKLKKRHKVFVDCYLRNFNHAEAARAIGYSENSAPTTGARLCRRITIKAAIDAELCIRAELTGITPTFVLNNIKGLATGARREADRLTALTLLGKHLKLFADQVEVNVTHDLADRVAQARARVTSKVIHGTLEVGERQPPSDKTAD